MRRFGLALAAASLLVSDAHAGTAPTQASVNALRSWITAVRSHHPGQPDSATGVIAALKYSDRLLLHPSMQLFLEGVRGLPMAIQEETQREIKDLVRVARFDEGLSPFVRRAAILHTDAAIFADRFPDPPDDAPAAAGPGSHTEAPPPLLDNERYVLHTDGRVVGDVAANWNWAFARSLLDLLLRPTVAHVGLDAAGIGTPLDRAFVADWYHAVAAYQLATRRHGDANRHLHHAAQVLPDDPRVLFDRACYAETLGLALYQVLPNDPGYGNPARRVVMRVPPPDKTDAEAEALFRRALEVDPKYAEARVRLARLLEQRGIHDEATAQIEQALASDPSQTVSFFAHLVAGRIEQSRGHDGASLDHYSAALQQYPEAQSALLGASHAAVMASDVPAALAFVATLAGRTGHGDSDPWWTYDLGAGRDVDRLVTALWAHVPK